MTISRRGLMLGAIHAALTSGVAAKYLFDRFRLPRVWVKTVPIDPRLPIRGRYLDLRLKLDPIDVPPPKMTNAGQPEVSRQTEVFVVPGAPQRVDLVIHSGQLAARSNRRSGKYLAFWWSIGNSSDRILVLQQSVPFFLPEDAPDPSRLKAGEDLWVEVSVPEEGLPRPLGLAIGRDGRRVALRYR